MPTINHPTRHRALNRFAREELKDRLAVLELTNSPIWCVTFDEIVAGALVRAARERVRTTAAEMLPIVRWFALHKAQASRNNQTERTHLIPVSHWYVDKYRTIAPEALPPDLTELIRCVPGMGLKDENLKSFTNVALLMVQKGHVTNCVIYGIWLMANAYKKAKALSHFLGLAYSAGKKQLLNRTQVFEMMKGIHENTLPFDAKNALIEYLGINGYQPRNPALTVTKQIEQWRNTP